MADQPEKKGKWTSEWWGSFPAAAGIMYVALEAATSGVTMAQAVIYSAAFVSTAWVMSGYSKGRSWIKASKGGAA